MVNGLISRIGKKRGIRSGNDAQMIEKIISIPYLCTERERGFFAKKCYSVNDINRFECDGRAFAYSSKERVLFVLPSPNNHPLPSREAILEKIKRLEDFKKGKIVK